MKSCRLVAPGAVFALLVGLSVTADGRNNADSAVTVTEKSEGIVYSRFLHWGGDLAVSLTNAGRIGNAHGGGGRATNLPPDFPLYYTPSFQFPFASDDEYLYNAGLWIGGIVNADTFVTVAYDGWSGWGREFTSFASLVETIDSVRGHQVISAQYTDTVITPSLATHNPLGIGVTQVSHTWKSAPYDRFVIVEYTVTNISDHPISDAWIGLFVDSDVFDIKARRGTYRDDVSGYLLADGIAYAMDNDGDPEGDTLWSAFSARGAIGVAAVMSNPPATCTTFNWWTSDGTAQQDWGPRRLGDTWDFGHGGNGTPLSDQDKYHVMSNGEKDYDQLWTAVDRSSEGWKPPPDPPYDRDIANGLDTRFVLAFGAYDLAPGDSVHLVLTLVAGDSVHGNPGDYAAHYDPADPQAYGDRLYLGNMIANAEWARQVYRSGFDLHGAAPLAIECTAIADDVVHCEWTAVPFDALAGFRFYRRIAETAGWTPVADLPTAMPYWDDAEVAMGETYEYAVSSIDTDGVEGPRSHTVEITVGRPVVIPKISVVAGASWLTVDWRIPPAGPDFAVPECVNLYRRVGTNPEAELVGRFPARAVQTALVMAAGDGQPVDECTTPPVGRRWPVRISPPYHDEQVTPGVEYHFSAAFLNGYGLLGDRSTEVSGAVMTFDREGLVILHTQGRLWNIQDRDTTSAFYGAWAERWGFDTVSFDFDTPWYEELPPERLAHYRFLLIVMEDTWGNGMGSPLVEYVRVHLEYSGRVVFVSRYKRNLIQSESFFQDVAGIERFGIEILFPWLCMLPWCDPNSYSRFRAASSRAAGYPDLDVDSARAADNDGMRWMVGNGIPWVGGGLLPGVGVIDSVAPDVEVLYSFVAGEPDTEPLHGKPVAIKRETEKGRLIYFGFPLSVMDRDLSYDVLTTAFVDLGFYTSAAGAGVPIAATVPGIIGWLYGPGGGGPDLRWDVNRDGKIDIVDAVEIVDRSIRR